MHLKDCGLGRFVRRLCRVELWCLLLWLIQRVMRVRRSWKGHVKLLCSYCSCMKKYWNNTLYEQGEICLTWCLASSISMALGSPAAFLCSLSNSSVLLIQARSSSSACWNCPRANSAPSSLCYTESVQTRQSQVKVTWWKHSPCECNESIFTGMRGERHFIN